MQFRKAERGETIDYDCGCTYRITKVERRTGVPLEVEVDSFCNEHDPTIADPTPEED